MEFVRAPGLAVSRDGIHLWLRAEMTLPFSKSLLTVDVVGVSTCNGQLCCRGVLRGLEDSLSCSLPLQGDTQTGLFGKGADCLHGIPLGCRLITGLAEACRLCGSQSSLRKQRQKERMPFWRE